MFDGMLVKLRVVTLPRYLIIIRLISSHVCRWGVRVGFL
jgi:hypothetical protein